MTTIVTAVPRLPPRAPDSHKGTYGRVLIVAGSRGMSGAAILAGLGALRGGAGLVQVATAGEVQPVVASYNPCYLTTGLPQDDDGVIAGTAGSQILAELAKSDVLAIGPGLGQSSGLSHVLRNVLTRATVPVVIDADGLNALAGMMPLAEWAPAGRRWLLTPHPGEFARLCRVAARDVAERREELAIAFAAEQQVVLVLKGHQSLVTDGRQSYRNTTGNPGMATGGTGDVLTGLIAALLGQGMSPFAAAQLGTYLHGAAGDRAAQQHGQVALIATDLVDALPWVIANVPS
jgi:NAD(P)H-hydrate epimerase